MLSFTNNVFILNSIRRAIAYIHDQDAQSKSMSVLIQF